MATLHSFKGPITILQMSLAICLRQSPPLSAFILYRSLSHPLPHFYISHVRSLHSRHQSAAAAPVCRQQSTVPHRGCLSHLEQVDDERQDIAHEEHEDDDHEHGGHADLALLHAGQLCSLCVGPSDLHVDAQVEGREAREWHDVHHHQVHPRDVNTARKMQTNI